MLFPLAGLLFLRYLHGSSHTSFRSLLKLCHFLGEAFHAGLLLKITISCISITSICFICLYSTSHIKLLTILFIVCLPSLEIIAS